MRRRGLAGLAIRRRELRQLPRVKMTKIPNNRTIVRLLICPTGRFANSLSSPFRKNISLSEYRKLCIVCGVPSSQEGRLAIVTDVEAGCGGRSGVARRAH